MRRGRREREMLARLVERAAALEAASRERQIAAVRERVRASRRESQARFDAEGLPRFASPVRGGAW